MSLSRRKFIQAGIIATVCAPLVPLKFALAQSGPETHPPSSAGSIEQLDYYNESAFNPYLNTRFRVYLGPTNTRSLKLTEITDHLNSLKQQTPTLVEAGDQCFSLLFTIPPGKPFTQDTYLVEHDALGTFYMFIVPVSAHSNKSPDFYEAIIYRRQQSAGGQLPLNLTGGDRQPVAVATPQPSQPRVSQAGPRILLPGSLNAKDERDIYRFRPAKEETSALAEQSKGPRVQKNVIHPLTLGQSPGVKGLRLGMTTEQVLALFPGSKTDPDVRSELDLPPSRFGVSSFKIRPENYSSKSKFEGVSQINFTLLDGRVSTLYVGYNSPVWEHVDEFVTKFSERQNLPAADQWEAYIGMDDQLKTLKCREFEVRLFAGGRNLSLNYAQLRDLLAVRKHRERVRKAKAEAAVTL